MPHNTPKEDRNSVRQFLLSGLVIKLLLKLVLDHLPAFLGMRDDALGAVLEPGRQNAEVAGTAEQKERAVAEEAGLPVLKLVARQKLAFGIDEMFIVHSSLRPQFFLICSCALRWFMQYSWSPSQVEQYLNSIVISSFSVMPQIVHLWIKPFFSGSLNELLNPFLLWYTEPRCFRVFMISLPKKRK